jgi:hypothetical protein
VTDAYTPSASSAVKQGVTCLGCFYELGGLQHSLPCPECGKPITESLRGNYLQYADRAWFKKLLLGARMTMWGFWTVLITLSFVMLSTLAYLWITQSSSGTPLDYFQSCFTLLSGLALVSFGIALILSMTGWFILTTREPNRLVFTNDRSRKISRYTLVAWIVLSAVTILGYSITQMFAPVLGTASGYAGWALHASVSGCFYWFSMAYIRDLANRMPAPRLARHAHDRRWVLVLLTTIGTLLCGLGPLIALLLFFVSIDELCTTLKMCHQHIQSNKTLCPYDSVAARESSVPPHA